MTRPRLLTELAFWLSFIVILCLVACFVDWLL